MLARAPTPSLVVLLAALASPALAQGLGVNVGGVSVGVDVDGNSGAGAPGVTVTAPGVTVTTPGGKANAGARDSATGAGVSASTDEVVLTQAEALTAVSGRKALPLDQVMLLAQASTDGQIIDARLVSVSGFLLYVFKVLRADGDVTELYFYARSGQMVGAN